MRLQTIFLVLFKLSITKVDSKITSNQSIVIRMEQIKANLQPWSTACTSEKPNDILATNLAKVLFMCCYWFEFILYGIAKHHGWPSTFKCLMPWKIYLCSYSFPRRAESGADSITRDCTCLKLGCFASFISMNRTDSLVVMKAPLCFILWNWRGSLIIDIIRGWEQGRSGWGGRGSYCPPSTKSVGNSQHNQTKEGAGGPTAKLFKMLKRPCHDRLVLSSSYLKSTIVFNSLFLSPSFRRFHNLRSIG